ncbi:MAG: hypothetical protein HY674_07740 [Chloroflexi bacterium]|nr:hypothetical protein [Chloroflexota bacterium]
MGKHDNHKLGHAKILEAWEPPDEAGESIGCIATTFTFEPPFFEEECLGRFLGLETTPSDGAGYLVEREEKLAQIACAAVLVDQHHARGIRSLRWDLLSARVPAAILHAKVSLLLWSRSARLIVASANLTKPGYRLNHEVFGVLDYFAGSEAPLTVLADIFDFLRRAASFASSDPTTPGPAVARWNNFLDRVLKATRRWGAPHPPHSLSKPRVFAVTTGPKRRNAFETIRECWLGTSPPKKAFVVSPFFDPPEAPNTPARELWNLLHQRGPASIQYEVTAEELPDGKGVLLHAPEALRKAQPASRDEVETFFRRLKLEEGRPLHAKCLRIRNEQWILYQIGSSNFTTAGLGFGKTPNLEANLAYTVNLQRNAKGLRALMQAWLESEDAPADARFLCEPCDDREDAPMAGEILLPAEFGEATFACGSDGKGFVELTFQGSPPSGWRLLHEDKEEVVFNESRWRSQRRSPRVRLDWREDRPPSALRVRWGDSAGEAWWAVNARDASSLPPPSELRNLSLDALIEILTSARPLHQVMRRLLQRRNDGASDGESPQLDPHKRVDTSGFLLQRTRRISWALKALGERLAQPVPSCEALNWRLHGPQGVMALVNATSRENRPDEEKSFLLAEIAVELARVVPQRAPGCLQRRRVRAALRECIRETRSQVPVKALRTLPELKFYVRRAFKEASA